MYRCASIGAVEAASRRRRWLATALNDSVPAGGDPYRHQRSQWLLYFVKYEVRSSKLVGHERLEAALSFHGGYRSGLAAV